MGDSQTNDDFFGDLVASPLEELTARGAARRIEDLTAQVEFFEREVDRYRTVLEQERIRYATQIAELQLIDDTRLDTLRGDLQRETQRLHDSYKAKLSKQQVQAERELSDLAAKSARDLDAQRERHESILASERTRRGAQVAAATNQASEEATAAAQDELQLRLNELEQARATIARLEAEHEGFVGTAKTAVMEAHAAELRVKGIEKTLAVTEEQTRKDLDRLGRQRANALHQLDIERQRSSATLADLLEQSAALAAESDAARAEFREQLASQVSEGENHAQLAQIEAQARYDSLVADFQEQLATYAAASEHRSQVAAIEAQSKYDSLAQAADEHASAALQREASLESVIAELRQQLLP